MTETPQSGSEPTGMTGDRAVEPTRRYDRLDQNHRNDRLTSLLAWVGIVAGIVFVIGVVFFAGFFIGRSSGEDRGYRQLREMIEEHHEQMMEPGGMMGPGQMGPGGPMTPQPSPTTTAPMTPRP